MKSSICDLLGIKYPILQGGMAWVSTAKLAAAVSNAGGLGIIAAGNAPASWVRDQITEIRTLTDKPFGINVMLLSPYVDDVMEVICEQKVPVITTGAGNPGKYIEKLKAAGTKVIPVIPAVALAKKMESAGADAVIAEGTESGGHVGELTTMALVPQVVDSVTIPVIAAGGIADSRGVVAALALGASGVQIGTRFLCSTECTVHENYKNAVLSAKDRDTIVTGRSTGHPVRALKNKLAKEYDRLEKLQTDVETLEKVGEGTLRIAAVEGDVVNGSIMSGQIAGLINDIMPCAEIIKGLVSGISNVRDKIDCIVEEG